MIVDAQNTKRPAGMDGMNNDPLRGDGENRSVGIDGMNKNPLRGGEG